MYAATDTFKVEALAAATVNKAAAIKKANAQAAAADSCLSAE